MDENLVENTTEDEIIEESSTENPEEEIVEEEDKIIEESSEIEKLKADIAFWKSNARKHEDASKKLKQEMTRNSVLKAYSLPEEAAALLGSGPREALEEKAKILSALASNSEGKIQSAAKPAVEPNPLQGKISPAEDNSASGFAAYKAALNKQLNKNKG